MRRKGTCKLEAFILALDLEPGVNDVLAKMLVCHDQFVLGQLINRIVWVGARLHERAHLVIGLLAKSQRPHRSRQGAVLCIGKEATWRPQLLEWTTIPV